MKTRGTLLIVAVAVTCLISVAKAAPAAESDELADGFRAPPPSARPQVWWHWMNGNVSKAGITADLEAMAANGFGGGTIVDADEGCVRGDVAFATESWYEHVAHAVREARRLGLQICLPNCSGWSSSGGPWIAASNAMKKVVFTETKVRGPCRFDGALPRPPDPFGFYADIAVLAFPEPAADRLALPAARVTDERPDPWTVVRTFSFDEPQDVSGFAIAVSGGNRWIESAQALVQTPGKDGRWHTADSFVFVVCDSGRPIVEERTFSFTTVRARTFRLTVRSHRSYPVQHEKLPYVLSKLELKRNFRLTDVDTKAFYRSGDIVPMKAVAGLGQAVPLGEIRVLDPPTDERVSIDVPPGDWVILRVGYAANGMCNHPATKTGLGFECDKLDRRALDVHFDAYVGEMIRRLSDKGLFERGGKTGLTAILTDSYEVGTQNWTHGLERTFERDHAYSPIRWLVAFTGRIVNDVQATERFFADLRSTIGRLFVKNYGAAMAERCHDLGLQFAMEPYGNFPADRAAYARTADIPMGEFWMGKDFEIHRGFCRFAVDAAREADRRIIGAEAFTADRYADRWSLSPFDLKAQGDRVFRAGVNRFYLHSYVHQPWPKVRPGMTMAHWGTHFDRNSTWWPQAREWVRYLTRCQYLLQAGTPLPEEGRDNPRRRYADGSEGYFLASDSPTGTVRNCSFPVSGCVPELWDPATGDIVLADDWSVCQGTEWLERNGRTFVRVPFDPCGSVFVMFRPKVTAGARRTGGWRIDVGGELRGPWRLSIAEKELKPEKLFDWTTSDDPDIRFFSGCATYRITFDLPANRRPSAERWLLDLGDVRCLADIELNGHVFPALWKPPYCQDVTSAVRETGNKLTVRVSNLWANRLIGDASLPPDGDWKDGFLQSVPDWVLRGEPSPTGRRTFSAFSHWSKDDSLIPSGLLGPVVLRRKVPTDK